MASGNFARGFLSTFGPSYELAQRQKQDSFRTFYSDFLDRRKEKEKFDQADSQNVKKAKALVENFPDAPKGAWTWVYKQLSSGIDQDLVLQQLQNGSFKPSELPAGQVGKTGPVPLDQQTQQGLGAHVDLSQTNQIGQNDQMNQEQGVSNPDLGINDPVQNLRSRIRSLFDPKADKERMLNSAIEEAARTSGYSPEQIKEIMKGGWSLGNNPEYTSAPEKYTIDKSGLGLNKTKINSMDDAIAAKRNAINTGNLQEADRIQGFIDDYQRQADREHGLKNRDNLGPELVKPVQEYNTAKQSITTSLKIGNKMLQIAKDNPDVLDARLPGIASWTTSITTSFQNAAKLVQNITPENKESVVKTAETEIKSLTKQIDTIEKTPVGKNITRLDKANRLMTLEATLMAYELAKSRGETGRSLTAIDFQRYIGMVQNGVTPDTFKQSLALLLGGELDRVRSEGEVNVFNNPLVINHNKNYPDIPYDVGVTSIDEDIANDPDLARVEAELSKYGGVETTKPEDQSGPAVGSVEDGYEFIGGDPADPNSWKKVK